MPDLVPFSDSLRVAYDTGYRTGVVTGVLVTITLVLFAIVIVLLYTVPSRGGAFDPRDEAVQRRQSKARLEFPRRPARRA